MLRYKQILIYLIPGLVFGTTWLVLISLHDPFTDWCTVTLTTEVTVDQIVQVEVHYSGIEEETRLVVDFHWNKKNRQSSGYLSSAGYSPIIKGEGVHVFNLKVINRKDIGFISVVIYLSKAGKWNDRTMAAQTTLIRVRHDAKVSSGSIVKTFSPHVISMKIPGHNAVFRNEREIPKDDRRVQSEYTLPAGLANWLMLIVYTVAVTLSVTCAFKVGKIQTLHSRNRQVKLWWVIAIVLLLLCILRQQGFQAGLIEFGRELSRILGLYSQRQVFQSLIIAGIVSVWVALLMFMVKKIYISGHMIRLALFSIISLCCLFIVQLLSFHYVDKIMIFDLFGFRIFMIFELCFIICICISSVCCLIRNYKKVTEATI